MAIVATPTEVLGVLNDVEAKNAPRTLYLMGDRALLDAGPRVSIVGARKASAAGLCRAATYARRVVEAGGVVVSGLAEGIDTAAHEAAIDAGGRTIAVLGTSLDGVYPAANRRLQEKIGRDHLLVTQFGPGMPIGRKNFPMRNRTMALLSHATLIVEAGEASGSLHQGWEALRLGRLLVLDEEIANDRSLKWPAEMIRYGAQVLGVETTASFLEELPIGTAVDDFPF